MTASYSPGPPHCSEHREPHNMKNGANLVEQMIPDTEQKEQIVGYPPDQFEV